MDFTEILIKEAHTLNPLEKLVKDAFLYGATIYHMAKDVEGFRKEADEYFVRVLEEDIPGTVVAQHFAKMIRENMTLNIPETPSELEHYPEALEMIYGSVLLGKGEMKKILSGIINEISKENFIDSIMKKERRVI